MSFSDLIGQDELKERLGISIEQTSAQSFLFTAPAGMGKHMFADELAASFVCSHPTREGACGKCNNCTYFRAGTHPDVRRYETDKGKKSLSVATIREEIIPDTAVASQIADKKVYIVNIGNIELKYQNLLLKVLEEPPKGVVFILLCTDASLVLPTIMSRVVEFKMRPYTEEEIFKILSKHNEGDLPEDKLRFFSSFSAGTPGKGLTLIKDEDFMSERDEVFEILMKIPKRDYTGLMFEDFEFFSGRQERISDILLLMMWFLGDLSSLLASMDTKGVKNRDKVDRMRSFLSENKGLTLKNIYNASEAVTDFNRDVKARVNFEAACCTMLLKMKKEFT